jgi:hypothetical protein
MVQRGLTNIGFAIACVGLTQLLGCSRAGKQTSVAPLAASATTQAVVCAVSDGAAPPAMKLLVDAKYNFSVVYPADWINEPESDNELTISPPHVNTDANQVLIQVPSVPPLLPGMITLGMVQHGYVNDLEGRAKNVVVKDTEPGTIPDAKSRVLTITGDNLVAKVVIIIRGARVFMLVSEVQPPQAELASKTIDAMEDSWKWTK